MNKSKPSKLSRRLTMQKLPINVLSLASSGKRVCSDDENKEPSVGGSSGTACNKRAYSDDDDSPVEPGQQTSLQSAMAGEMSKILDSFGNDVAKSLRAKKRRLWQHLRATKKMDAKQTAQQQKLNSEVKDEILGLQEKILTDAQEHEIVKMRSNLQSILM
ncbi:hypothetical protein HPB47_019501 [Ixodes persulcatus]|uniref:Uncharacterized protein n=1 Tax=Ixodes persulcatus TaxID=34615 RepID=A0AC60QJX4_IXOPE|nr:hypothetical protein HPB47_019501 [Ixodes persulcatus]